MTMRLEDRAALVTGAASGAGRAMALRCAAEGAAVLCADINEDGLAETVSRIARRPGAAAPRPCGSPRRGTASW